MINANKVIKVILILLLSVSLYATDNIHKKYTISVGHLKIKEYHQLFFDLKINEVRTDTIFLYNSWDSNMQLEFKEIPSFLSIEAMPNLLAPKSEGYLLITYYAEKRDDFGMVVDRVDIVTNDTLSPLKSLELIAVITEDFANYTLEDFRNAPMAVLDTNVYDFGMVKQGSIASYNLKITNIGKDSLIIRKITSSCGCTTVNPERTTLATLESATIQVLFNTYGREGHQRKSVTIITNDPDDPYKLFTISGTIEK